MPRKSAQDVRQRLLSAGLKLFAEKGFDGATVREICDAAHSNLAAINYYFHDKAGYYAEVRSYAENLRRHELQNVLSEMSSSDPWDILRRYIDTLLDNAYDNEMFLAAWFCMREFLSQKDAHESARRYISEHRHRYEEQISILMTKLLGEAATEQNIALLHYTNISMSLHLVLEANLIQDPQSSLQLMSRVDRLHLREHIVSLVRYTAERMKAEYAAS